MFFFIFLVLKISLIVQQKMLMYCWTSMVSFLFVVKCLALLILVFAFFFSQDQCWFRQSGQTSSRNTRPHLRTTQFLTTSTIWTPRLQGEKPERADVLPPCQHITRSPGHCLCFSVEKQPSGTWPFLTAGLRGPCWRGSTRSKLTFLFLSFMDRVQTSTVSLDMRLRKPDQMWKSG